MCIDDNETLTTEAGIIDLSQHQLILYIEEINEEFEYFLNYIDGLTNKDLKGNGTMPVVKEVDERLVKFTDGTTIDFELDETASKYEEYFIVDVTVTTEDETQYEVDSCDAIEYADMEFAKNDRVYINEETKVILIVSGMDELVYIPADSNMDCEIDSTDLQRLYTHLNGSNKIGDENQLVISDINGDTEVDSTDLQRLYTHLNGSNPL